MSEGRKGEKPGAVDLYGPAYGQFDTDLYAEVRAEAFGADIGQTGWLTASEMQAMIDSSIATAIASPTSQYDEGMLYYALSCQIDGVCLHLDSLLATPEK